MAVTQQPMHVLKWRRIKRKVLNVVFSGGFGLCLLGVFYAVSFWYAGEEDRMPLFFKVPIKLFWIGLFAFAIIVPLLLLAALVFGMVWAKDRQERVSSFMIVLYIIIVFVLGLAGYGVATR